MISRKLNKKALVIVPVAAAVLGAGTLLGYANYPRIADGWDPGGAKTIQEISRGESPGEHGPGGERGVRGESGGSGSEEASGAILALNETFDATRGGARLTLNYDTSTNAFVGLVENTTNNVLSQVRIEVHLSNGTELGPTAPVDLAPGQVMMVKLPPRQRPSPAGSPMPRSAAAPREPRLAARASASMAAMVARAPANAVVKVARAAARPPGKPPCPAPSPLWTNPGTACWEGWPCPHSTTRQPSPSTRRCRTPSPRPSASSRWSPT